MLKKYQVVGSAGCSSETVLFDDESSRAAIDWAKAYTRFGDWVGHESITVLCYNADGEAVDLWRICDDD